jgi:hypothetical protein
MTMLQTLAILDKIGNAGGGIMPKLGNEEV